MNSPLKTCINKAYSHSDAEARLTSRLEGWTDPIEHLFRMVSEVCCYRWCSLSGLTVLL